MSSAQTYQSVVLDEDYLCNTLSAAFATLAESLPTTTTEVPLSTFRSERLRALYRLADDPSTEPDKPISSPGGLEFSLLMVPDLGQTCCPCCMDVDEEDEDYYPPPVVQSDTGVTRRQIIRTIADTLYGEEGGGRDARRLDDEAARARSARAWEGLAGQVKLDDRRWTGWDEDDDGAEDFRFVQRD